MVMDLSSAHGSERAAFTVNEFCQTHRLSRSKLYQLWAEGRGPRFMRVGVKKIISGEAAAAWRRAREDEASIVDAAG